MAYRGFEVLVKKASVDPVFRELLLDARAEAAKVIGLKLSEPEAEILNEVLAERLEAVIARAKVTPEQREVFLGSSGEKMLEALGAVESYKVWCTLGIRPDGRVDSVEIADAATDEVFEPPEG
jgi:hypothetical protein